MKEFQLGVCREKGFDVRAYYSKSGKWMREAVGVETAKNIY